MILEAESVDAEDAAVSHLARAADGSMRDGLSLMDQAIAYGGGKLNENDVASMLGSIDHAHITALVRSISEQDADAVLAIVAELTSLSRNLSTVLSDLAEAVHRIVLVQCAPNYRDPDRSDWDSITELAEMISPEEAQLYYQVAIKGQQDLGLAPDPRTGLEMTLLRMMAFRPAMAGNGSDQRSSSAGLSGVKRDSVTSKMDPAPSRSGQAQPASSSTRLGPEAGKEDVSAGVVPDDVPGDVPQVDVQESYPEEGIQASLIAEPAAATPAPGDSLGWHTLSERLNLKGPSAELARNITLRSSDGDQWQFVIPSNRAHLGSDKYLHRIGEALAAELGHPVNVSLCSEDATADTPAMMSENVSRQRMSEAEKSIENDPTIQDLKQRFGAELDAESIQPLQ
jgi:DNA polymerase-3 subunit gamma/tau